MNRLEKEKEQWAENLKILESVNCKESDILDLDVGGIQKFSTTRSTLTKVKFSIIQYPNSALSAMFSGRHELTKHNGRIFIDRDGNAFINLVNYLSKHFDILQELENFLFSRKSLRKLPFTKNLISGKSRSKTTIVIQRRISYNSIANGVRIL